MRRKTRSHHLQHIKVFYSSYTVTITGQNVIYLLCDVLATLEVMISIRQDLWLHDGHDAVLQNGTMRTELLYLSFIIYVIYVSLYKLSSVRCFSAHLLADACIASQDIGVLHDRQL